jgi:hypothetical protein
MTEHEVFVLADRALNDVVAKIGDGHWDMQMPPSFARPGEGEPPTLREIANYHAHDDSWVPDMLAGKTMDEAGHDNFKFDLLRSDPKRAYFCGLRAHDIARVMGVDPGLPADLVQGKWDELRPVADEWRELGAFPPRVDVPADAPLQDRLHGLTGRDPYAA